MSLGAGKLRERVTFEKRSDDTRDALGSQTSAWVEHATVWAQRIPGKGDEVPVTGQLAVQVDETFVVRHRTDLLETMRLVWRGAAHEIVALSPDVKREFITVQCTKGIRDGR